jgi:hypothetical protein
MPNLRRSQPEPQQLHPRHDSALPSRQRRDRPVDSNVTLAGFERADVTLWLLYDHNVTRVSRRLASVTLWLLYDHNVTRVSVHRDVTLWLLYDHNVTRVSRRLASVTLWWHAARLSPPRCPGLRRAGVGGELRRRRRKPRPSRAS